MQLAAVLRIALNATPTMCFGVLFPRVGKPKLAVTHAAHDRNTYRTHIRASTSTRLRSRSGNKRAHVFLFLGRQTKHHAAFLCTKKIHTKPRTFFSWFIIRLRHTTRPLTRFPDPLYRGSLSTMCATPNSLATRPC